MFYSSGGVVNYPQIEDALRPILMQNDICSDGLRAESRRIADSLFFAISKTIDTQQQTEWDFHWELLKEIEFEGREPLFFMKVDKYTEALLCMDRIEVNPRYRGIGINPTVQSYASLVMSQLSENYVLDFAVHLDINLTAYFIRQNRYALHEIQNISSKFYAIDEYYSAPGNVTIGFNPNLDARTIVQSEFVGLDINQRLIHYKLLARFVDSVTSYLTQFYNDPSSLSEKNQKFLFNVIKNSGFNECSVQQILSHSVACVNNRENYLLFQNFQMYFAENYYKISQKLGMMFK